MEADPRRNHIGLFLVLAIVSLVFASAPAAVWADNPVAAPLVDTGVVLEVVPWVEIPDSSMGRPRLNAMASTGERVFVVEEWDGDIWEITTVDNQPTLRPFLNVKDAIASATSRTLDNTNRVHGGLRGLAFHPAFAENGLFYTSVMETRPAAPNPDDYISDVPTPIPADSVVIEWTYDHNRDEVDPASYRQVFRVGMPVYDHPIKQIAFDPFAEPDDDGYGLLYVAHGDGSVNSATAGGGQNNDALGKILRIDPRQRDTSPYSVPESNPFVDDATMINEAWSIGHRNPHHLAFVDDAGTSRLIAAEPGRDNVEEVNVIQRGGNYGWSMREGTFVHLPGGTLIDGVAPLPVDDALNGFIYPAAQLGHDGVRGSTNSGRAIAGGFAIDNGSVLSGHYFYADFARSGTIYHSSVVDILGAVTELDPAVPDRDHPEDLTQAPTYVSSIAFDHDGDATTPVKPRATMGEVINDSLRYDGSGRADVRFGQGPYGELYILNKRDGWIYIVSNSLPPTGTCDGLAVTIAGVVGTDGDDVMIGSEAPDILEGGSGNDTICGGGGNDLINGGDGDDRLFGGDGNDRVYGGPGLDFIDGGPGRDVARGGPGDDVVVGGRNNDRISGNGGRDTLIGGNGRDRIDGQSGPDFVSGGGGNDRLFGGGGFDSANGKIGTDFCAEFENLVNCEFELVP
ncbi:MAG: hypothetical protein EX269_01565 [Acidimicrobiales bacterium]|nr:MAG: hypothetical protein EX269_01565 [Acidimicrobiales bacterium]